MSASEIIEQIKVVREAKAEEETRESKFQRAADAVFRKHDDALRRLAQ